MTVEELKRRLIDIGLASVLATETEVHIRRGGLAGFERCKQLHTPADFETALTERYAHESRMAADNCPMHIYAEYRMETLQIEHVYERLKVAWGYPVLSSRAVLQVAKVMQEWARPLTG